MAHDLIPEDGQHKQETEVRICSICHQPYTGWPNNAKPINDGECCRKCDDTVVTPARRERVYMGLPAY